MTYNGFGYLLLLRGRGVVIHFFFPLDLCLGGGRGIGFKSRAHVRQYGMGTDCLHCTDITELLTVAAAQGEQVRGRLVDFLSSYDSIGSGYPMMPCLGTVHCVLYVLQPKPNRFAGQ